jgi:hypothetical protein
MHAFPSLFRFAGITVFAAGLACAPALAENPKPAKPVAPLAAGQALERWENMTPQQRERALAKLTPERRTQVEERLRRLEQLPVAERQQLRERYQEFQRLPRERQDALRLELQALRTMRPLMRQRRIASALFQRQYSQDEQRILREAMGME